MPSDDVKYDRAAIEAEKLRNCYVSGDINNSAPSNMRFHNGKIFHYTNQRYRYENFVYEFFYDLSNKMHQYISYDSFKKEVDSFVMSHCENDCKITSRNVRDFIDSLLSINRYSYIGECQIFGFVVDSKRTVKIGPFKIAYYNGKKKTIFKKDTGFYISTEIKNLCDTELVRQKSIAMFEDFIRILVFMQRSLSNKCPVTIGVKSKRNIENIVIGDMSEFHVYDIQGNEIGAKVDMDYRDMMHYNKKIYYAKKSGFDKIWQYYERYKNGKSTDMEGRIVRAILEAGKSVICQNINDSIVSLSIGYESLFTYDKSALYTPGITANIAERTAFLCEKECLTRIELSKFIKKMYASRSDVVHGKEAETLITHYQRGLRTLHRCIHVLLTRPELTKLKTFDQVTEWIEKKRFK